MKTYTVEASIVFEVDAENEDEAIERASECVYDSKPSDFEYNVEKK